MSRRVAVVLVSSLLVLAGCTSTGPSRGVTSVSAPSATAAPAQNAPSSSSSEARVSVNGVPDARADATDQAGPDLPGVHVLGPTYELTPAGPLDSPATVTVTLPGRLPAGEFLFVATRESAQQAWTYLPTRLASDGLSAHTTTTHFSFFSPVAVLAKDLAEVFRTQFAEALTGGLFQAVDPPSCEAEKAARRDGYAVKSSRGDSVFWCLGLERGQRVLRVTNHRRYPIQLTHGHQRVLDGGPWAQYASLAALSHSISGARTVVPPGGTVAFDATLAAGGSVTFTSSIDGFGQSLVGLQTGIGTLLAVTGKFGGTQATPSNVLRKTAELVETASGCAQAFPNAGKVLTKCFSEDGVKVIVGSVWAPVALAVLTFAEAGAFIQAQVDMFAASVTGDDRYTISLSRAAPAAPPPCTVKGYGINGANLPVDLADSGLTCQQALTVLSAYSGLVASDDGTHGNTAAFEVSGFLCASPTTARSAQINVVTGCERAGERASFYVRHHD